MIKAQFEKEAMLGTKTVSIPNFDMQVSSLAFEYVCMNFKYLRNIKESQHLIILEFANDIEAESRTKSFQDS